MSIPSHTVERTAMRVAAGCAGLPWIGSFAIVGGHADSGFGLVVVDQGNPRHRAVANALSAVAF
jgi:hypothetical protein